MACAPFLGFCNFIHNGIVVLQQPPPLFHVVRFQNLTELSKLAAVLGGFYKGKNDLYEDVATHRYYLLVSKSSQSPEEFNKVCNILSEYGAQQAYSPATEAFFGEHYRLVIKGKALQMLAAL